MSRSDDISRHDDARVLPLRGTDARKLAWEIAEYGIVKFSRHAEREMAKDRLEPADCVNLLRAGVFPNFPERENGEWRYRIETARMCVVIAFMSAEYLRVVTAWRKTQ